MKYFALQIGESGNTFSIEAPASVPSLNTLSLSELFNFIFAFLGVVALLLSLAFIIYGGFLWIVSEGDKKRVADARNAILWAIIGLFVAASSLLIVGNFARVFGVLVNLGN